MLFSACILILTALLFSCSDTSGPESGTTGATPESTLSETDPAPTELILLEGNKTDFRIIRGEEVKGYYQETAMSVREKFNKVYNSDISVTIDWYNPNTEDPTKDHEILLFDTSREESKQAMSELTFNGYIIRVTDCKIVVVGSGPSVSNAALHELFDTILPQYTKDGIIALPVGLEIKKELEDQPFDFVEAIKNGKTVCGHIEEIYNCPARDGFTASQGIATDGKYVYTVLKKKLSGSEVDRIVKIDMETWTEVKQSEELPLDHANDMTYDPIRKQLVVVNMVDSLITLVETENLTVVETKKLSFGTWGTGYISSLDRFAFLAYGTPSGLVTTDREFNPITAAPLNSAPEYVGQGMDADDNFAYVPLSPNAGKSKNIIQIYDIATGEYKCDVAVMTKMESESIFHVGNKFYIQFNAKGATICTLEFYEKFE
jgi:hypothetical protein